MMHVTHALIAREESRISMWHTTVQCDKIFMCYVPADRALEASFT